LVLVTAVGKHSNKWTEFKNYLRKTMQATGQNAEHNANINLNNKLHMHSPS